MSNVLVTLEYHRHGDTLCSPCDSRTRNTKLRWQARFALTGEPIGGLNAASPFCNAARVLLERGYDPDDMLYLVDVGATDITRWRLRGKLGKSGTVTTIEPDADKRAIHLASFREFAPASVRTVEQTPS